MRRWALIKNYDVDKIKSYLPANYHVVQVDDNAQGVLICGEDDHGWTLDDYVIPRLHSGLIVCVEVWPVFISDQSTGGAFKIDVPNNWIIRAPVITGEVEVPQSDEARDRHESNLVQIIISHEACDDLVKNDETSWTCELNPDFVLQIHGGNFTDDHGVTRFDGTLEQIFQMLDSDQLRRIQL